MEFTYRDFIYCLNLGEEIEFSYQQKRYSISFSGGKCYLTEYYNDKNEQEYNCIKDLIKYATIEKKHLIEIWENIDIIAIY